MIYVRGWLDPSWVENYHDISVSISGLQDQLPVTRLTGGLADQSALVGILVALHELGLTLLSVEWREPASHATVTGGESDP